MKTLLIAATLCLCSCPAFAADSVRFAERLRDVRVCTRFDDGDGGSFSECEIQQRNSGSFRAQATIAGLSAVVFEDNPTFSVRIGGYDFSDEYNNASRRSKNRVVFNITEEVEAGYGFRIRRLGTVTFSRAGDVGRVSAVFSRLPASIVADGAGDDGYGGGGSGSTEFYASVGDVEYNKIVYYRNRITRRGRPDYEGNRLKTVTAAGFADFRPPTVRILAPRKRASTTSESSLFHGTAKDNVEVTAVYFRVGESEWFPAYGTTRWSADVPLELGTNLVQIMAVDPEGLESRIASRSVIRLPMP